MVADKAQDRPGLHRDETTIHIDHSMYKVEGSAITGAQLRQLPTPAIGPDMDLWQDVPGSNDIRIEDSDTVALKNGMHFFTAPAVIAPGR